MSGRQIDNENISRIEPFMRFFLFCSAANQTVLKNCPSSERHKYAGVGATVFFTGVLASLSGGYAIYTVFNSLWIAIVLGLFWGALVFNLDRFIVSTIKKSDRQFGQWKQVFPRILLAVFLAIIISKPLELKIFEQEINEKLHYTGVKKIEAIDQLYEEKLDKQRLVIESLKQATDEKFELRERYYEDYKCECEGTCGTEKRGIGSECLRKEKKYIKSDQEYQLAKFENDRDIQNVRSIMNNLEQERNSYKDELKASFSTGLLARLNALHELPLGPSIAIVLLLICIELAPILTKLLSPYGPYDHLLKTIEYKYEIDEISTINARNQKLNNQLTLMASVEEQAVEQQVINNKKTMQMIEDAQLTLVQEQLDIWVENEKQKLRNGNPSSDSTGDQVKKVS